MKGKLLISSPGLLTDMIFYKSIILIVDQTDEGITGFILNRPSDLFMYKEIDTSKKIKIILLRNSNYLHHVQLYHQDI